MLGRMSSAVHVGVGPAGTLTYVLDFAPHATPGVRRADLARAWEAAHAAAASMRWGVARALLFRPAEGTATSLAIADPDARCWAGAVDATLGLDHPYGIAVCLRLLALVELLARAPWLAALYVLDGGAAEFHPALLSAAATCALDSEARLVEGEVRERLRGLASAAAD
jgi:hypothetical protein